MKALSEMYPKRTSDMHNEIKAFIQRLRLLAYTSGFSPRDRDNFFERQRRNIGRSYGLSGEMLHETKKAIKAIKDAPENVGRHVSTIETKYVQMLELELPEDIMWQFKAEVGQELVEVMFCQCLFPTVFYGMPPLPPPPAEKLKVTPQAWLSGIGDVAGELGKIVNGLMVHYIIPKEDEHQYRMRHLELSEGLNEFLEEFEAVYPRVINNSRRPGYFNTYRGMLGRLRGAIMQHQNRVLDALNALGGSTA